ncbi:4'-phosphopantetheinyl transferase superfamily protein [Flavobacterium psychroterrae]|uniref:4'-phosphopantetheinyl transferase superfamily protein n=1 Tax=Flavobacterium psychroterrae TaxID=2133767 RepID=A0ABS5PHJ7_9FLAO|nr:4'-phosphopantetheinyl transferase superfamily protein [Flavobacterium psychroterrae]MBS7233711.1 4'-phosphopantetheinyl transferase superfamily protein [Flavobacterium psychroterrae]
MIHIYYAYLSEKNHENLVKTNLHKFPQEYQNKIKSFRRWQDAQSSMLGRLLLYKGIKELYGNKIHFNDLRYTRYKKPYFEDSFVKFNISHSGEIVVCALCDNCEIGIDIELVTNVELNDFKSQMTSKEWDNVLSSNSTEASFFDYWTQKEAVLKAYGNGLTIPLRSFEILDNKTQIKNEKFFLKKIAIDEKYKCYIAQNVNINQFSITKYNQNL